MSQLVDKMSLICDLSGTLHSNGITKRKEEEEEKVFSVKDRWRNSKSQTWGSFPKMKQNTVLTYLLLWWTCAPFPSSCLIIFSFFLSFFFTFRLNLHRRRNQLLASATKKNKIKQNSSRKRATEKKRRENERTNNTSSWNIIWNFDTISLCFRVFFSGDMSFRLFNT